ncbi:hypothetical protein RIF29_30413 [Crotalaria pallida]|uniref:Uncharacterized protein n=1 Tax=Crotalaria pallida TaxID=3830 RepID=A0AAN9HX01_CROPI
MFSQFSTTTLSPFPKPQHLSLSLSHFLSVFVRWNQNCSFVLSFSLSLTLSTFLYSFTHSIAQTQTHTSLLFPHSSQLNS